MSYVHTAETMAWMQEPQTCPNCGRHGVKAGMATHIKFCLQFAERFWAKVNKRGPTQCWPWTGRKDTSGYGRYGRLGPNTYPHRIAWTLTNGSIPDGLEVAHTCDNWACCNPAHFFLASHAENMADCKAKDRQAKGERVKRNKITETQARNILALKPAQYPRRTMGLAGRIAVAHNITQGAVNAIWSRRAWKHLKQCGDGGLK